MVSPSSASPLPLVSFKWAALTIERPGRDWVMFTVAVEVPVSVAPEEVSRADTDAVFDSVGAVDSGPVTTCEPVHTIDPVGPPAGPSVVDGQVMVVTSGSDTTMFERESTPVLVTTSWYGTVSP